ncbi:pentapeptide repeat-containing protein [Maricaulis sp.]|uniref:pentapeptide repeat-containing protein n=1 Tax=Maricaulis sp. TaxID=1486257 RepID=UPI003A94DDC8
MKRILVAIAILLSASAAANAQDAAQIARVQAGQSCPGCNLFQAELSYRDLPDIDLSGSRLRQANLALATMNRTRFDNANLSVANMFGARFSRASFRNADLSHAVLVGTYFGGADLSGANLAGANISGAEMALAVGLTQTQLNQACGDASTELPAGLRVRPCRP